MPPGQRRDVERETDQRERAAPGDHRGAEGDDAEREQEEHVPDLAPTPRRADPLLEVRPPRAGGERRVRRREVEVEQRGDPGALDAAQPGGDHEQQPGDREGEEERDQQPEGGREQGDDQRERDRPDDQIEQRVRELPPRTGRTPRSEEVGEHPSNLRRGPGSDHPAPRRLAGGVLPTRGRRGYPTPSGSLFGVNGSVPSASCAVDRRVRVQVRELASAGRRRRSSRGAARSGACSARRAPCRCRRGTRCPSRRGCRATRSRRCGSSRRPRHRG